MVRLMDEPSTQMPGVTDETPVTSTLLVADVPAAIEAALISCDKPLSAARLAELLPGTTAKAIAQAIEQLNAFYDQHRRSFRIESLAGGWQIVTRSEYAPVVSLLHKARQQTKLTPAILETLAIVAYKQPVLRAEVESIRGVACGEALRTLMDRRLVKIVGRAEEVGRPMLYGTTKTFLEVFGLSSIKDLPSPPSPPSLPSSSHSSAASSSAATSDAPLAESSVDASPSATA